MLKLLDKILYFILGGNLYTPIFKEKKPINRALIRSCLLGRHPVLYPRASCVDQCLGCELIHTECPLSLGFSIRKKNKVRRVQATNQYLRMCTTRVMLQQKFI